MKSLNLMILTVHSSKNNHFLRCCNMYFLYSRNIYKVQKPNVTSTVFYCHQVADINPAFTFYIYIFCASIKHTNKNIIILYCILSFKSPGLLSWEKVKTGEGAFIRDTKIIMIPKRNSDQIGEGAFIWVGALEWENTVFYICRVI